MPSTSPARRAEAATRAGGRLALSGAGLVVLALVVGPLGLLVHDRWGPLVRFDERVTRAAEHAVDTVPGLLVAARTVTYLGDPQLLTAGVVVAAVALFAAGRRRSALYLLVVRLGSQLLSTLIKSAVGRARPRFTSPVATAFGLSFPSGHALGSSAVWLAVAVVVLPLVPFRRLLVAGAVGIALLVSASRVLLGVHYLSDVTAGFLLGTGWTIACTYVFALWRRDEGRPVEPYEEGLEPELGR